MIHPLMLGIVTFNTLITVVEWTWIVNELMKDKELPENKVQKGDSAYFVDYKPPARDAIALPRNVLYVLAGVVLIVVATYAIVGHLINDLMHDLADWILGPKVVVEDAERRPGSGDDEDDDDEEEEEEEERRMSKQAQAKKESVGLLPGVQKLPGYVGFTNQQKASRTSTQAVSISIPYVTSL